MWNISHKNLIFGLLLGLALFGTQLTQVTGRAFALTRIAADATASGPLEVTTREYRFPAILNPDVLDVGDIITTHPRADLQNLIKSELWAQVFFPAKLDGPPHPLLVFLHGNHASCKRSVADPGTIMVNPLTGECPTGFTVVPNHAGYGYLGERLASWGFVVVSINANRGVGALDIEQAAYVTARARLVLKHLEKLSQWHSFGSSPSDDALIQGRELPNLLQGKLDFTQVGLLGHSIGGEGVRAAYSFYELGGDPRSNWVAKIPNQVTFRGIFEIGTNDGEAEGAPLFDPLNVKWNALLPMCDGDVIELQGVKPFDRSIARGDRVQKSTFAVWGANHNFYNTEWQVNEKDFRSGVATTCVGDGNLRLFPEKIVSPEQGSEQRQTALASVMAFFRANVGTNANPEFNQIFNPEFELPPVIATVTRVDRGFTDGPALIFEDFHNLTGFNSHGQPNAIPSPALKPALKFEDFHDLTGFNSPGRPNTIPNDIVGVAVEHDRNSIPDHNAKDHNGRQTNRWAGLIFWNKTGGFFQTNWTLPGNGVNISQFQTLEFRVSRQCRPPRPTVPGKPNELPCSGNPPLLHRLNPTEPTNFSVQLALSDGTLSQPVQLVAYADLAGPIGTPLRLHPILQTVRIPLADFRKPLLRVRGVRFTFDHTPTGAIYMSDIRISTGTQ